MRFIAFVLLGFALTAAPSFAQDKPATQDSPAAQDNPADTNSILLEKLKADKKLIVSDNMQLTEREAKGFWPIYDAYQADLHKANNRLIAVIQSYANDYQNETMTDQKARKLVDDLLAIENGEVQRQKSYVPKLMAVLPPRKVMRYLQIESKIRAVVRYQLAQNIPLVE